MILSLLQYLVPQFITYYLFVDDEGDIIFEQPYDGSCELYFNDELLSDTRFVELVKAFAWFGYAYVYSSEVVMVNDD